GAVSHADQARRPHAHPSPALSRRVGELVGRYAAVSPRPRAQLAAKDRSRPGAPGADRHRTRRRLPIRPRAMTSAPASRRGIRTGEWAAWLVALALVTVVLVAFRARLNEAHYALAYLLLVQGASARGGRPLGVALAVGSLSASTCSCCRP